MTSADSVPAVRGQREPSALDDFEQTYINMQYRLRMYRTGRGTPKIQAEGVQYRLIDIEQTFFPPQPVRYILYTGWLKVNLSRNQRTLSPSDSISTSNSARKFM